MMMMRWRPQDWEQLVPQQQQALSSVFMGHSFGAAAVAGFLAA